MAEFIAGADVLTYDFTRFVPGAKGEIPEPTSQQIETFLEFIQQVMPTKAGADGGLVLDVEALAERFKDDDGDALGSLVSHAVSEVCSNTPTADQIEALPHRPKQAFYAWIMGTFLAPEA